jgi:hypothetical protein
VLSQSGSGKHALAMEVRPALLPERTFSNPHAAIYKYGEGGKAVAEFQLLLFGVFFSAYLCRHISKKHRPSTRVAA